mmetsp:Transcript_14493/g.20554  ORF Transcript_14493/g.20554 Transcript_14493/m.20554 type:complete len:206 (+) Transcript_14493:3448-4065(+)
MTRNPRTTIRRNPATPIRAVTTVTMTVKLYPRKTLTLALKRRATKVKVTKKLSLLTHFVKFLGSHLSNPTVTFSKLVATVCSLPKLFQSFVKTRKLLVLWCVISTIFAQSLRWPPKWLKANMLIRLTTRKMERWVCLANHARSRLVTSRPVITTAVVSGAPLLNFSLCSFLPSSFRSLLSLSSLSPCQFLPFTTLTTKRSCGYFQ